MKSQAKMASGRDLSLETADSSGQAASGKPDKSEEINLLSITWWYCSPASVLLVGCAHAPLCGAVGSAGSQLPARELKEGDQTLRVPQMLQHKLAVWQLCMCSCILEVTCCTLQSIFAPPVQPVAPSTQVCGAENQQRWDKHGENLLHAAV